MIQLCKIEIDAVRRLQRRSSELNSTWPNVGPQSFFRFLAFGVETEWTFLKLKFWAIICGDIKGKSG